MIRLNVGGKYFDTSKQTLEFGSEYFKTLINETYGSTKQPDGSYFIDRSPLTFEIILNYLRGYAWTSDLVPANLLPLFIEDCNFYGLTSIS